MAMERCPEVFPLSFIAGVEGTKSTYRVIIRICSAQAAEVTQAG